MKKIILLLSVFLLHKIGVAQDTIMKRNGDRIIAKVTEVNTTEIKYKKFNFQDGPVYIEKKFDIESITYSTGLKERFEREKLPTTDYYKAPQRDPDYYGGPVGQSPSNKITEFGSKYNYQNRRIVERELHNVLMSTNDKHIMGLVQSAKEAHGLQFIGFAGIPLGIAAVYCLAASQMSTTSAYNSQTGGYTYSNPNQNGLQAASAICAVIGFGCPIASTVFKYRKASLNREAIQLYNQKY